MPLSNELVSQFAKITNDNSKETRKSTVYGEVVEYDGKKYIKLDGSEWLTPASVTTNSEVGDRVVGSIENHTLTITGNVTSPSATTGDVEGVSKELGTKISEFEVIVADKVDTDELNAQVARIDTLVSDNVTIRDTLTANDATIRDLTSDNVIINENLLAMKADIVKLEAENATITGKLEAADADIDSLQADNVLIRETLTAKDAIVTELQTQNVTITGKLDAADAAIENLKTEKLSATDADLKYANIDFTNIGEAAMEYFYANSGLIKDVTIGDATITGHLVGVTISGDLIEGNTIVAEKLVIKGEDGLYYKLNTNGVTTETEQTEYNSLNGTVIQAKSITATKIDVKDLVAFDATIGGFNISENSIYSGVKSTADNTTRGIYLDNDGQIAFGDASNYIRYYKDADGSYKLAISAESLMFTSGVNVEDTLEEAYDAAVTAQDTVGNAQAGTEANASRLDNVESAIVKIEDTFSTLVKGENGESLMTQTDDGWTFSMTNILNTLNNATNDINTLNSEVADTNASLDGLNQAVKDLGEYTEYIKFDVDNGQPCIILGETDSSFKVMITNTDIRFMEGSVVPASISNQSLNIEKAVIHNELKQGGFVWMARPNGNYGLIWKGE